MKSDARDGDSECGSGTWLAGAGAAACGAGMLMPTTVGQSTDK